MPEETTFRQMDEKHVSVEVQLMVWSPKFDLVALSNVQGEVVLHRLSWQKVWSVPSPSEDVKVKALSWRPDGKVLAAGYSNGKINLYHIENAEILHTLELQGEVTCMEWVSQYTPEGTTWSPDPYLEDDFSIYLPKLQSLGKNYGPLTKGPPVEENVEDSKKLGDQKELNLLIAGCGEKDLHIAGYGVYPISVMAIPSQHDGQVKKIHSAMISQNLQSLSVVVEVTKGDNSVFYQLMFDTMLISARHKELRMLSLKCGQVATLIGYLQQTVQQMSEAWEDILQEMDSKLKNFANIKRKMKKDAKERGAGKGSVSTVSNDFLELLMFGTPSQELSDFLLHDLDNKKLKKLGLSVETSYSSIQNLVVKHLQVVSQSILYHLSELRGMSLWFEKFGVLGLSTESIQKAVTTVGSFVLKTSELQQVIDNSVRIFKAFFRWLYVVILRLSNEKIPPDLNKMTQHDVNFVAEFLRDNFAHFTLDEEESDGHTFHLEKVGQYLRREDLQFPPSNATNPWVMFQKLSFLLKDNDVLYPVENNKSLIQLQDELESTITSALTRPSSVIGDSLENISSIKLFEQSQEKSQAFCPRLVQFTVKERDLLYTVYMTDEPPCKKCIVLRQPSRTKSFSNSVEAVAIQVGILSDADLSNASSSSNERCKDHLIQDMAFYDEKILSLLLVEDSEDRKPILAQLPLVVIPDQLFTNIPSGASVEDTNITVMDIAERLETTSYRRLENMKAHSFAVSGTRKTATVLFSSRRRVRIFLMDAEEEEDEEEEDDNDDVSNEDRSGEIDSLVQTEDMVGIQEGGEECEGQDDKENTSANNSHVSDNSHMSNNSHVSN